jgi:uncharacterized cupin superfamily protein
VGITHRDEAEHEQAEIGHLRSTWTYLGDEAESLTVGVNRIQVADGGWATPFHEHGRDEEIFYVLAGTGVSLHGDTAAEVRAGDCILYSGGSGAHTILGVESLDVLAFGTRNQDEAVRFPRLGLSLVGGRAVQSEPGSHHGIPVQWLRESELGPPDLPELAQPRPRTVVNVDDLKGEFLERSRVVRRRRDLGRAIGSIKTGLKHVELAPGKESSAMHCHSLEEEVFYVLDGDGVFVLGEDELAVRPGTVIARPAGTGVAHVLRAGADGMTFLAYDTREPGDICYYPRSNKIAFRGVGVMARLERLDYWDGED